MKKQVIKTALITLAVLVIISALAFGSFCLFAPASAGEFFSDAGKFETALRYAERAYEKEGSAQNLKTLVNRAINANDEDKIIAYGELFLKRSDGGWTVDEVYRVAGKYCVALIKKGEAEKAVSTAALFSGGYGNLNPFESIILHGTQNKDKSLLQLTLAKLEAFKGDNYAALSETAKERLDVDIQNLTAYLELYLG